MSAPEVTSRSPGERTTSSFGTAALGRRSAAISDRHLSRLAIVYVRQSSTQPIFDHQESRERPYALADYAAGLGWPRERILVTDDDQGRSGRTVEQRPGLQRLLAEWASSWGSKSAACHARRRAGISCWKCVPSLVRCWPT